MTVADLIRSVSDHAIDRMPDAVGSVGEGVAGDFERWLDAEGQQPETPPEWFAAWNEYCSQYNEESYPDDDGQPDERQEWHDYDPDC